MFPREWGQVLPEMVSRLLFAYLSFMWKYINHMLIVSLRLYCTQLAKFQFECVNKFYCKQAAMVHSMSMCLAKPLITKFKTQWRNSLAIFSLALV